MYTDSVNRYRESYQTRFGAGYLVWLDGVLARHMLPGGEVTNKLPRDASQERSELALLLERYFAGEQVVFPDEIPQTRGQSTGFGLALERALAGVGYGDTITYGELASAAGYPRAHRAAGSWLARNPLPVIVPCHRVIRADGSIGSFSGGDGWKQRLLTLEGATG